MRDGNRRGFESGSGTPFGSPRPPRNGTNGVHPEGLRTRSVPFDDIEDPIDLVAVQADDELISALAAGMAVTAPGLGGYDADDHVAAILATWKAEVDAEPIPELVDLDTAMAALAAGRPQSRRARHLAPVAAAAAFIVLAIGGVSVGSADSEPGDALWGVSKVLYSERAESVEAADRVETRIAKAKQALVGGDPDVAAQELKQAEADLALIRPEEGKTQLADVQEFLQAKASETPQGIPNDPGTPLATNKARKVPAGAAITADPKDTTPLVESSPDPLPAAPEETVPPGTDVTPPAEETTSPPTSEPTATVPPVPGPPPPATAEGGPSGSESGETTGAASNGVEGSVGGTAASGTS